MVKRYDNSKLGVILMTALYEQDEIRFLYPENWELDNRGDESTPWSVSVHSPNGAFWSIVVRDKGTSLSDLAIASLDALRQEYPESFSIPSV